MNFNPTQGLFEQSRRTPERLALYGDGIESNYDQLVRRVAATAAALRDHGIGRGSHVAILGSRSRVAVEAVLAAAWCGAAYVPLGPRWPEARILNALDRTAPAALIADEAGAALLARHPSLAAAPLVMLPDADNARALHDASGCECIGLDTIPAAGPPMPPQSMSADDLAYLIFTSGTTGEPKGVMVACGSLAAYLTALAGIKAMTPADRASQFTELSFDPSVGEIFVPLYAGASLHIVPPLSRMSPARFIRERQLTVWGATPSAIAWMRDARALQPGCLPGLRYSSFGGEPLPRSLVEVWQAAAPNSVIDNFYGPTEATVDCACQRILPGEAGIAHPGRGIMAIGVPHAGSELAVFSPTRERLAQGEIGELAVSGAQLALGYLDNPALTAERFPCLDGQRWYFTGDLAVRDAAGMFHHLGRVDNQIKIQGHRVELEEIEAHLREVAGTDQVAAVAWPVAAGVAQSIVAFVAGTAIPTDRLREQLRQRMPHYMVPAAIHALQTLPRQTSGKLDRRALIARLEGHKEDGNAAVG